MKFFAFVLLFAAVAYAADDQMRSAYGGSAPAPAKSYGSAPAAASSHGSAPAPAQSYGSAPASGPSYKSASSYGGGSSSSYGSAPSIPAPPCHNNYLFSCQPSMQPVPCSQPAPSYGSSGAYATNYPIYALPQ